MTAATCTGLSVQGQHISMLPAYHHHQDHCTWSGLSCMPSSSLQNPAQLWEQLPSTALSKPGQRHCFQHSSPATPSSQICSAIHIAFCFSSKSHCSWGIQAPDRGDPVQAVWSWIKLHLAVGLMEHWARLPDSSQVRPFALGDISHAGAAFHTVHSCSKI